MKANPRGEKIHITFASEEEQNEFCKAIAELTHVGNLPAQAAKTYRTARLDKKDFYHIAAAAETQQGEPFAIWYPLKSIKTDPERFQNRKDAFSEISAEAVAKNLNWNIFDPIVVWKDPADQKIYVLSGHSRHEGLSRRKEPNAPIRFFQGTEEEAIKFARLDANRGQQKESLIEDLKAFRLMKFGDEKKGLKAETGTRIKEVFKGETNKLTALSHLDENGKFIEILSQPEVLGNFPKIANIAQWTGELRQQYPEMSNTHEADIFNYIYGDADNWKIKKADFTELIKERLFLKKPRLFPECPPGEGCKEIRDLKEIGENRELYRELYKLQNIEEALRERLSSNSKVNRIYTDIEREAIKQVLGKVMEEAEKLRKNLNIVEAQPSIFGFLIIDQDTQEAIIL